MALGRFSFRGNRNLCRARQGRHLVAAPSEPAQEINADLDTVRSAAAFLRSREVPKHVITSALPAGGPVAMGRVYQALRIAYTPIDVDGTPGSIRPHTLTTRSRFTRFL